jgi:hypothetical protein
MEKTEKAKPFDYDALIVDLIQRIDKEESLFSKRDLFHGWGSTLLFIFEYLLLIALVLVLSIGSVIQNITFAIAVGALLLSFVSAKSEDTNNNVVEANFKKAVTIFKIEKQDDKKRIILEALLKIKAEKTKYKLATTKEIYPGMFAKEKLIEKLYE